MRTEKLLGQKLKELRELNGYTQQQVAEYLSVDQSLVAKYEKGDRGISLSVLKSLSKLYGCSFIELVDENAVAHKPIALAYRATNILKEDMEAIAIIKQIALNIRIMEDYLQENN